MESSKEELIKIYSSLYKKHQNHETEVSLDNPLAILLGINDNVEEEEIQISNSSDELKNIKVLNFKDIALESETMLFNYLRYTRDFNEFYEYEFDSLAEALEHYKDSAITNILVLDVSDKDKPKPLYALQQIIPLNIGKESKFDKRILFGGFACFKISRISDKDVPIRLECNEESCGSEYTFAYLIENFIDLNLMVSKNKDIHYLYYSERDDD